MEPLLSSLTTNGIKISVQTLFIADQSSVEKEVYVFAYKIEIQNLSSRTVQLVKRKWLIVNSYGEHSVIVGDGVVGQQPILAPGQAHRYMSGCVFKTPIGKMEGTYTMVDIDSQEKFQAVIPNFILEANVVKN
ncbi:MAG: Co2+/Mg2+ efflux protein ApaG [Bacteroidia bacterium]|nr:Co2+/Mg2+ efflux protein ApaG [Bacteroidia bacterium]